MNSYDLQHYKLSSIIYILKVNNHNTMDKKYKLENATQEEVDTFNKGLQELTEKIGVQIKAIPVFTPSNDGGFKTDAQLVIYKKLEVEEEGVVSPFSSVQENGETEAPKAD